MTLYLAGVAVGFALQYAARQHHLPPSFGWGLMMFGSLYLFTFAKMSGLLAALSISWTMTSILMASPLSLWMTFLTGAGLMLLIEPLFAKPDISSADLPTTMSKPILQEEFFTLAKQGVAKSKIFIGTDPVRNRHLWIDQRRLTEHMQVVGITGCGKTQFLMGLAYQGMMRKWGVMFVSGKPSFVDWRVFSYLANHCGRGDDLYYFNPLDPDSDTFNPIAPVSGKTTEIEIAHQIMRAIGREPPSAQERLDAFHRVIDFERILHLSSILVELKRPFTLEDCYYYYADEIAREYMLREAEGTKISRIIPQVRKQLEGEILKISNPAGLTSSLRPWIANPLSQKVNDYDPDINIPDLFMNGGLAYFSLSPGRIHQQANALGRQIVAQVLSTSETLREKPVPRPPMLLILDEFSEYLTPAFTTLISQARSGELCLILAHQDFGQLLRIEGMDKKAFTENVINNSSTKVFFSTLSPDSAEQMSELFGTKKTLEKSQSYSFQWQGNIASSGMSQREGEEFIVHPNWFKTNKTFLAACKFRSGCSVIRTVLFDNVGSSIRKRNRKESPPKNEKRPLGLAGLVNSGFKEELETEKKLKQKEDRQKKKQDALKSYDQLAGKDIKTRSDDTDSVVEDQ